MNRQEEAMLNLMTGMVYYYGLISFNDALALMNNALAKPVSKRKMAVAIHKDEEAEDSPHLFILEEGFLFNMDLMESEWLGEQHDLRGELAFRPVTEAEGEMVTRECVEDLMNEAEKTFYHWLAEVRDVDLKANPEVLDELGLSLPEVMYSYQLMLKQGTPLDVMLEEVEEREGLTPMQTALLEPILKEWAMNTPLWALKGWRCSEVKAAYPEDLEYRAKGQQRIEALKEMEAQVEMWKSEIGLEDGAIPWEKDNDFWDDSDEPFGSDDVYDVYEDVEDAEDVGDGPDLEALARQGIFPLEKVKGPYVPSNEKKMAAPGRNDPCPCGSGKKYKKCCGSPEATAAKRPGQSSAGHSAGKTASHAENLVDRLLADRSTQPTREAWEALFCAADDFREAAVWDWMFDVDIFAIKDPKTGLFMYCNVLGNGDTTYALNAYLDTKGLRGMMRMFDEGEYLDSQAFLLLQNCLSASYEDRIYMSPEDMALVKKMGRTYRENHHLPQFRRYEPGYYPWYINAEECRLLTMALEQGLAFGLMAEENPSLLDHSKNQGISLCYLDEQHPEAEQVTEQVAEQGVKRVVNQGLETWKTRIISLDEILEEENMEEDPVFMLHNQARLQKMLKLRDHEVVGGLEVDFFYTRESVQESRKDRPYFPVMGLIADHHSGIALNYHLFSPEKSSFWHQVEWVVAFMEKSGRLPELMLTDREDLYEQLDPVCQQLGITLRMVNKLHNLHEAREQLEGMSRNDRF